MPPAYIRSSIDGDVITDPDRPIWVQHPNVTIRWTNPSQWLDCGNAEFGVRGIDGKNGLKIHGLQLEKAGHGTRLTNLTGELIGCKARRCGAEGFQGGGRLVLTVEDCDSREHGWGSQDWGALGIGANRSHGFYFECRGASWDSPGLLMRRCTGDRNNGMGLHLRGEWLVVEDSEFTRNAPGDDNVGAGNVQLTSAKHVLLRRVLMEDGDSGLTLYAEPDACSDVTAENCAIWQPTDAFAVSAWANTVLRVTGGVVCGRLDKTRPTFQPTGSYFETATEAAREAFAIWRDLTPAPPPNPVPVPTPDADPRIAALEAENAELRRRIVAQGELAKIIKRESEQAVIAAQQAANKAALLEAV